MKNSNSRVTFRLWVEMSQGLLKANLSAAGRKEVGRSACEDKRALGNKQLRTSNRIYIEHRTNLSSGGKVTPIEIGTFLGPGRSGPEHQALLRLIASLVDEAD
jgi:hypothetical protein